MVWMPPALVAIVPPTVAESRAARSTPYSSPARAACARSSAIVTPAPAVTWPDRASTGSSRRSRRADRTTAPPVTGTPPPTSPVFPPCGTTGAPCRAQARRTAPTWAASAGRTTPRATPLNRRVQSVVYPATRSGSVSTCSGPAITVSSASRVSMSTHHMALR